MNQKSWANFQLFLRLFQMTVFLAIIGGVIVAVAMTALTIGDVFACALSLIPTGWGLISVSVIFSVFFACMHFLCICLASRIMLFMILSLVRSRIR